MYLAGVALLRHSRAFILAFFWPECKFAPPLPSAAGPTVAAGVGKGGGRAYTTPVPAHSHPHFAMRLGFPAKILARPGLRSHDSRRWQNHPHLSVSLVYLRDLFFYLDSQDIRMYRLSDRLAPYLTHAGLPQFHRQIEECAVELAAVGQLARDLDLRLSLHVPAYVLLNTPDPARQTRSLAELDAFARILDGMGLAPKR